MSGQDWPHSEHKARTLVVLDLDDTVVLEEMGARRNEHQRFVDMIREAADEFWTLDAATLARKVADQIEEQTKPPRIPEPGLWGVVKATLDVSDCPRRWIRDGLYDDAQWVALEATMRREWDHLVDPVLVRPGIEDAP